MNPDDAQFGLVEFAAALTTANLATFTCQFGPTESAQRAFGKTEGRFAIFDLLEFARETVGAGDADTDVKATLVGRFMWPMDDAETEATHRLGSDAEGELCAALVTAKRTFTHGATSWRVLTVTKGERGVCRPVWAGDAWHHALEVTYEVESISAT